MITASAKQEDGHVPAGTKSSTKQLNTQAKKTVTPSTESQIAVSSGTYVTGDVTVDAIPSNYIDTSDADAVASDIVLNKTAYVNGSKITGSREKCIHGTGTGGIAINTCVEVTGFQNNYRSDRYGEVDLRIRFIKDCYANTDDTVLVNTTLGIASTSDVISGKTFSSINGLNLTGTMPSKDAATITPTTTDQTIDAGQYLAGAQTIKGDANLQSGNIISGVSIFGVSGSVVIQKYYTGNTEPSSSLGNDGDLYLKS